MKIRFSYYWMKKKNKEVYIQWRQSFLRSKTAELGKKVSVLTNENLTLANYHEKSLLRINQSILELINDSLSDGKRFCLENIKVFELKKFNLDDIPNPYS